MVTGKFSEMSKPKTVYQGQVRPDIDRGWAWIVMIATYLGMTVYCTTLYMNGILYIALLDRYREGEAKTSLVGAVSSGLLCYSAPFGGVINNRFSCRFSIVIGGVLTTAGFALSAYVPSLNWMIVTSGVIVGLGYGISSSGLICVVGFYFEKWRDVVLSFAFLTVGVAMFLSAPLGLYLVDNYGLTATFLIIACIQAQMCVFGVICKSSVIENEVHAQKKADRANKVSSKSKTYLDLSLLKNVPYMGFLCSTATWNFALTVAIMHLPNYVSVLGGTSSDIGYLLSSFSVANLVGRLSGSLTISKLHHKSLYVHVIVLAVTGILSSLFPLYSNIAGGIYIFTIQLGIFTGWPNAMMTPLSLGFVGVAKLSEAYGLAYVFCGIGVSTGPVLIGYLYSVTGSYEYSFLVAGGVLILGCLFGVGTLCIMRKKPVSEVYMETVVADGKQADFITTINEPIEKNVEMKVQKPLLPGTSKSNDTEEEIKEVKLEEQETDTPSGTTPLIHSNE